MATKDDIFSGALNLPADDRAELAAKLLRSLDEDEGVSQAEVEEAWDVELERRAQKILDGRVKGIPLADVIRDLDSRRERRQANRR